MPFPYALPFFRIIIGVISYRVAKGILKKLLGKERVSECRQPLQKILVLLK